MSKRALAGLREELRFAEFHAGFSVAWRPALAMWLAFAIGAAANQSNTWAPTTGTLSGLALVTDYNNAFSALQSCNSGGSAPANDQTTAAVAGQCWADTHLGALWLVKIYDGSSWVIRGAVDTANHLWIANSAGGVGTIASAATTDLGSVINQVVSITGTTGISSFGSSAGVGVRYFINFAGILTLTHNGTSLILPNGGSNITTAAGDTAIVEQVSAGNWRMVSYQRANGSALSSSANFTGAVFLNNTIFPSALVSNTNNWNPAGLSTANTIVFSCNAAINISGIVAPATDGQVLNLVNIGSNPCTLTANDVNSSAANRFTLPFPVTIFAGRTVAIRYLASATAWALLNQVTARPPRGSFSNLRILNVTNSLGDAAPATPNNMMKILADGIVVDNGSGDAFQIDASYSYACTVDVTASGVRGLDTGSVAANTWYFLWTIYAPNINDASCLASVSSTAPTLPAGYTYKARVGANQTDGSNHFYRVQQYGRIAHYVNVAASNTLGPRTIQSGVEGSGTVAVPTYAAVTILGNAKFAPTTAVRVQIGANLAVLSTNGCYVIFVAPSTSWNSVNFQTNTPPLVGFNQTPLIVENWIDLEASSIAIANNFTSGSLGPAGCSTYLRGWEDNL